MKEPTPLQVLIDAKLSGTLSGTPDGYGYLFHSNEQAAHLAVEALEAAGYEIVGTENQATSD